jgi:hypothetical protein
LYHYSGDLLDRTCHPWTFANVIFFHCDVCIFFRCGVCAYSTIDYKKTGQNTIPLPSIRSSPSVAVVEPGDCFLTASKCFSEVLVLLSDVVGSSVYFRKEQYGFHDLYKTVL